MNLRTTCIAVFIFCSGILNAQDTLKVMTYNLLNYSGTSGNVTRYLDLKTIIDYTLPDIFFCNELTDATGADLLLNNAFNSSGRTHYQRAVFVNGPDSDNMLYFNSNKVKLHSQNQITTTLRDISRYRLYYNSGTDTAWINVISVHLKAGNTPSDESQRNSEASALCTYLSNIDPNESIILGGDFNFYSSTEPAYNLLTSNNCTIRFYDPINLPGSWHANSSFSAIHTQSTRSSANPGCCGGSTGGLDDRFDFILANAALMNGTSFVKAIPSTYIAFGNDNNHYNQSIVEGAANSVVPSNVNTALFNMSDHLPVMMNILVQWDLSTENFNVVKSFRFHFTGTDLNNSPSFYLHVQNAGTFHFEIIDALGKSVEKKSEHFNSGDHHFSFGKDLPAGIYFIRAKLNDEVITLKFIRYPAIG